MFTKNFIFIFILNLLIVAIINIVAYFYSYQVNLQFFLNFLAFGVIIGFLLIIFELIIFILKKTYSKDYYFYSFFLLLICIFLLKFYFFGEYYYFRSENYLHFNDYFFTDFNQVLSNLLSDFRNFNGIILINYFKDLLPKQGYTQYYIYNFFQFISGVYLYRIFSLFSKDKILIILLTFLYFGIEMFFIISYTITYVNIILSSFIIFLFYLFNLEEKKNISSFIFYFLSYLFLITSRPDFFFLALMIEFLNAYLKNKNIISFRENILFYMLLIPYYFIINRYLLTNISNDQGLLGTTYNTSNFWYIFFDKVFGEQMQIKLINNLQIISYDYLFIVYFLISLFGLFYVFYKRANNLRFNYLFLFIYSIFFFFIVIFIHKEGFISSFFKYFSLIYLLIYILFGFLVIYIFKFLKNNDYKILGYIILGVFIVFNYNVSLLNYNKLWNYSYKGINNGNLFKRFDKGKIDISIYDRIYDKLWNQNTLYKTYFLKNNINNGCRNILIGKFELEYTPLFPEYKIMSFYSYNNLLKSNCINLIRIIDGDYIGFINEDKDLIDKLNINFKTIKIYDKFIEKDKWINLYILGNKNAE